MDIATIVGMLMCFGLVIFGIVSEKTGLNFGAIFMKADIIRRSAP